MRFLSGLILGAAGLLVAGYFVASSGRVDVSATQHGGWNDRLDHWLFAVSRRSIEKHAPPAANPFASDPAAAARRAVSLQGKLPRLSRSARRRHRRIRQGLESRSSHARHGRRSEDVGRAALLGRRARGAPAGMPAFSPTHSPKESLARSSPSSGGFRS
mgnify:CR=1 FL=1